MKKNVAEACIMFFALVMWSCIFGAAVLMGILLLPLFMLWLLVLAIREIFRWKQKHKNVEKKILLQRENETRVIEFSQRFGPRQKAA